MHTHSKDTLGFIFDMAEFADLNVTAVQKITKKFDKKHPGHNVS